MSIAAASFDPALDHTLQVLALAERQLTDAADRLASAAAQARPLTQDTNWQTAAASRFHTSAERWRDDVDTLSVLTEAASDDVRRARHRVEAVRGFGG